MMRWRTKWQGMPPERNMRSIVEVPEFFVCGLLHESDSPTLLGSAVFSRAALSNTIWLSEGDRPGPKFPMKGMTWACAAAGRNTHAARAADSKRGDRSRILLSPKAPARPRRAGTATRQDR